MGGLILEKAIIRTKIIPSISSSIICESEENETFRDVIIRMGKEQVLKKIFSEDSITYDALCQEYNQFKAGKKNQYFSWMNIINSSFGVVLDEHIYLYRYNIQVYNAQKEWIPWMYADSKKYLGDTWWNEDIEILTDLKNLSIIDFLDKYKGI